MAFEPGIYGRAADSRTRIASLVALRMAFCRSDLLAGGHRGRSAPERPASARLRLAANAINLVRHHEYSVKRAAKTLGISAINLHRKLNAIGAKGDLQAIADAGDRRILEMSQAMSTLAGETLLEKMEEEGIAMKTSDLTKIYTGATNQVAVKQRWSHVRS